MNKLLSFILAFMLILSCQAAKKERLELNLTKGEVYHHKMITESTIIQSVYGSEMEVKTRTIFHTAYKVIDIKDSIYDLEVTYKSIYMKMSLPMGGGDMEINSEKAIKEDVDEMDGLFNALLNKPFNIKMSKRGQVKEISKLNEMLTDAVEKNMSEERYGQMKGQIGQMLGEGSLKNNFEMLTAIFPEKEVVKGDKWKMETKQESEMPMSLKTTYELKKIGKDFYEIVGNSTIKMNMENEVSMGEEDAIMIINMDGNMVSNIQVDKSTGWVNKATMNQEISGKIDVNSMMEIPMTMKSTIEIAKE